MNEEQIKAVKSLIREALRILEDVGEYTEPKKEEPTTDRHRFADIDLEFKDFDVLGVDVNKIFSEKSGTSAEGKEWHKQSIIITDYEGKRREVIAWGDHIEKFRSLRVGDRVDLHCLLKVSEYKKRDGTTQVQYTVGTDTQIEQTKNRGQHVL